MFRGSILSIQLLLFIPLVSSFNFHRPYVIPNRRFCTWTTISSNLFLHPDDKDDGTRKTYHSGTVSSTSRRSLVTQSLLSILATNLVSQPSGAVGPTKISLTNFKYSATPCPKDKPIPGEKAMKGMRGLCVTVTADLQEAPESALSKVGVYGFVTDGQTGDSVLANNPDLSTDAGQFAMIESISPQDKTVSFDFIAAIPMEKDVSSQVNGIGPLNFDSIRIISYPGGNQFGAISPCEMNEFSAECEEWEEVNGPYVRGTFMMQRNPRTRGS